jgi:hypothetical protein
MSQEINRDRRRFLMSAAVGLAAAEVTTGCAATQSGDVKRTATSRLRPQTNTSFAMLKQIDAGFLNVGYVEAGPADGPPCYSCTVGRTTFTPFST